MSLFVGSWLCLVRPFGVWNDASWGCSRVGVTRCWVLRDRAPTTRWCRQGTAGGGGWLGSGDSWECGALVVPIPPHCLCVVGGTVNLGGRSYVENYTVDASIFVALSF